MEYFSDGSEGLSETGASPSHSIIATFLSLHAKKAGQYLASRQAFDALSKDQQNEVIEFLKSLQILPPGSKSLIVNEHGQPRRWPPTELTDERSQDPLEEAQTFGRDICSPRVTAGTSRDSKLRLYPRSRIEGL